MIFSFLSSNRNPSQLLVPSEKGDWIGEEICKQRNNRALETSHNQPDRTPTTPPGSASHSEDLLLGVLIHSLRLFLHLQTIPYSNLSTFSFAIY